MHRPLSRPKLLHRVVPVGIHRSPWGQRTEIRQRKSAGHSGCADGRVGGREIKILQSCSRDTGGGGRRELLSAHKNRGRQEFTQATTQDRNHLRYPWPLSHHSQRTPSKSGSGTRVRTWCQRTCVKRKACKGDEAAIASSRLGRSAGANSVGIQCRPTTSPHRVIRIIVPLRRRFCLCSQVRARRETTCSPATCESVTKTKNLQPNRLAGLIAQHNPHNSALC